MWKCMFSVLIRIASLSIFEWVRSIYMYHYFIENQITPQNKKNNIMWIICGYHLSCRKWIWICRICGYPLLCILGNPCVTHYVTLHLSPLGQLAYVSSSSWIINEGIWLVISVFPWEILIYFYLAYSANNVIALCLFCEYPVISFLAIQARY